MTDMRSFQLRKASVETQFVYEHLCSKELLERLFLDALPL